MFNLVDIVGPVLKEKVIKNAKTSASTWAGRQKENLSPSIDYMCMTKAYFNFKYSGSGYLEPDVNEFSYENERAKEVGNQAHEFIQKTLTNAGIVRLCEKTLIDPVHHIKARLDLVVEINNHLYLVELKTAKSYSIKMMVNDGAPDLEHQKQVQLYFHLYEQMKNDPEIFPILKGRPLTNGIILYEGKDDHRVTEFLVTKNQSIINDLLRYGDMLFEYVKKGEQPFFKFEPDSRECLWKCSPRYYKICHGVDRDGARNKKAPEVPKDAPVWGATDFRTMGKEDKFV